MNLAERMLKKSKQPRSLQRGGTPKTPDPRQSLLDEFRCLPGLSSATLFPTGWAKHVLGKQTRLYSFSNDSWPAIFEIEGFGLLVGGDGEVPPSLIDSKVNLVYSHIIGRGEARRTIISLSYLGLVRDLSLEKIINEYDCLIANYTIVIR